MIRTFSKKRIFKNQITQPASCLGLQIGIQPMMLGTNRSAGVAPNNSFRYTSEGIKDACLIDATRISTQRVSKSYQIQKTLAAVAKYSFLFWPFV